MKAIVFAEIGLLLAGCAPVWSDDVDALLEPGSNHLVYRIRYSARKYAPERVEILAGPVASSPEWSNRFDAAMKAIGDKRTDEAHLCAPSPGVQVSVERDGKTALFLLCYECHILFVVNTNGEQIGDMHSFDSHKEVLGNLAMEAFPDDKKLADVINRQ